MKQEENTEKRVYQEHLSLHKRNPEKTQASKSCRDIRKMIFPVIGAIVINVVSTFFSDILKDIKFPYISYILSYSPSVFVWATALIMGWYIFRHWKKLKEMIPIPSHMLWIVGLFVSLFLGFYFLPYKQPGPPISNVLDFWQPFVAKNEVKIVTGSFLLWTGPHDPAYGELSTELNQPVGRRIAIYKGRLYLSEDSYIDLDTTNYMLARKFYTNWFDFQTSYEIRDFLMPKIEADIVSNKIMEFGSLNSNLILIGGPSVNKAVTDILKKLISKYGFKFSYEFLIREGHEKSREVPPMIRTVGANDPIGIGDVLDRSQTLIEYRPEKRTRFADAGRDGAIIIKTFNPDYRDKSILIIAGFEEHGTLAAIDVLRHNSPEMEMINNYYREKSAVEIVVETSVVNDRSISPRIIGYRAIERASM